MVKVLSALTLEEELVIPTPSCQSSACAAFSPDGGRLAVGSDRNAILILNAYTGELLHSLDTNRKCIWSLCFAHAGSRLASAHGPYIQVWDVETGACLYQLSSLDVRCVAFTPDDGSLVAAGSAGRCQVWDAQTGQTIRCLEAETRAVHALALSPDGSRLILGGDDRAVKIYEAQTGIELLALKEPLSVVQCAKFSPDGRTIAAACADGRVLLFHASPW
jgi:WD40 repeat protein